MDNLLKTTSTGARARLVIACAVAAFGSACGGTKAGPPGGFAMPVEVVTLAERPVQQATEYVGTVRSRRSTTVQPQVEGFVTQILVRSGDRVQPGTPLMRIDASMQRAAVAGLESVKAAREADVQYTRQQADRVKTLLEAGAASQAEMEQAQTALRNAEAQLRSMDAQIREQRVALGYHQVTSPAGGVVGDVPVRVGDSVTRSTVLTTIDQNAGLEVYINVPVQAAQNLRVGLPVHLMDDRGQTLTTTSVSFVAPSVEPATQSVLVKALAPAGGFRTDQYVRARIVWTEAPSLTVPVVALNRINGVFFAFVAEPGEGGQTVARQRAVVPGAMVGNDYVVQSGLKAGEKLIVSGVQKIRDGAPVAVGAPSPPPGKGA